LLRRTFLLGTAVFGVGCRNRIALGRLAYVDRQTLWVLDLPDGKPRAVTSGHRIRSPKFSTDGGRLSFRDGGVEWTVSLDGKTRLQRPVPDDSGPDVLPVFDAAGVRRAWTKTVSEGTYPDGVAKSRTTLQLESVRGPDQPTGVDNTIGYFDIAGFTRSSRWLAYWKAEDKGADMETDGLPLYLADARTGQFARTGVVTLVHPDMIAMSPVKDTIAVTAGDGRETWANKAITLIEPADAKPVVTKLTEPKVSAQLPAWSPDGSRLAWSEGPDAELLHKQQLLSSGRKTISVMDPVTRQFKEIPITPALRLGAPPKLIEQCVTARRIRVAGMAARGSPSRLLTSDAPYSDEEPRWSRDGSHILFCRLDVKGEIPAGRSIWLARPDGSEIRPLARLADPSDLSESEKLEMYPYYGYTDWSLCFDWWRGPGGRG
jgi:hypothetical protein